MNLKEGQPKPSHYHVLLPNAWLLADQFIAGGEGAQEAFSRIDEYLRPKLLRHFASRPKIATADPEDLTQETLETIALKLSNLRKRNSDNDDFPEHLFAWSFGIARNVRFHNLAKNKRSLAQNSLPADAILNGAIEDARTSASTEEEVINEEEANRTKLLLFSLKERVNKLLRPSSARVVNLALDGKTDEEISKQLGYSVATVKSMLSLSRPLVERVFLSKTEYRRVSSFDYSIRRAAKNKKLEAVMFLGILYTTDSEVRKYQENKRIVDKNLLEEGSCLLSEVASPKLYKKIREEHPEFLTKSRGKLYVNKDGQNFLDKENGDLAVSNTNIDSSSDTVKLINVAMTWKEYQRLKVLVKRGEIPGYCENRMWYGSRVAIDEFRQRQDGGTANLQKPAEIVVFSLTPS